MDKIKRGRVIRLAFAIAGTIFLCPLAVHFGRIFGPSLWANLHIVNFIVAWIPAILSILVAFVPDKELATRMRVFWRISVIVCGLLYSATLWHQQTLADIQSDKQIRDAVTQAVTDANKHSDAQFQGVQQNVGGVDKKVSAVGDSLNQTATALTTDIQRTSDAIQKTSDRLDASIGKVGKPDPTPPAILVFSLWDTNASAETPSLSQTIQPNSDGNYPVDFTIINSGRSAADTVDLGVPGLKCASG